MYISISLSGLVSEWMCCMYKNFDGVCFLVCCVIYAICTLSKSKSGGGVGLFIDTLSDLF